MSREEEPDCTLSPESAAAGQALSSQHRGSGEAGQEGCSLLLYHISFFLDLDYLGGVKHIR